MDSKTLEVVRAFDLYRLRRRASTRRSEHAGVCSKDLGRTSMPKVLDFDPDSIGEA